MKYNGFIAEIANILVNAFGDRLNITSDNDTEKYINNDIGQFNDRKGWYCIRLDNYVDWGLSDAFKIWKTVEKECQKYNNCRIEHAKNGSSNFFYHWGKKKEIIIGDVIIELNIRMFNTRSSKDASNRLYITTNNKELYSEIINTLIAIKSAKNNNDHTVVIDSKKYSTSQLANIVSQNSKTMVFLIEDMVSVLNANDYYETIRKMTKIMLEKYLETGYLSDCEEAIMKAAYIKAGGEGSDF